MYLQDYHSIKSMDCYSNGQINDIIMRNRPELAALYKLLSNPTIETELKSEYSFIIDQQYGKTYAIPYGEAQSNTGYSSLYLISEFFRLLEACRCANILTHFSEKQSFKIKQCKTIQAPSEPSEPDVTAVSDDEFMDDFDFGETYKPVCEYTDVLIDKSCIEFDFDIYLSTQTPIKSDFTLEVVSCIADSVNQTVELRPNGESSVTYYIAVLGKPQRQVTEKDSVFDRYGPCWKESFHVRIFIKVDKNVKLYIRKLLLQSDEFLSLFKELGTINPIDEIFDRGIITNPAMFLGSAKRGATSAHELKNLYTVTTKKGYSRISVNKCKEFKPIEQTPGKKSSTKLQYKYNLCYELSLNFEAPNGLIKKSEYSALPGVETSISLYSERTEYNTMSDIEIRCYEDEVTSISVRDFEAAYISKVLDIIARHRAISFDTWKIIVMALARRNKNYKPIAMLFSLRHAPSFVKGGRQKIDELFAYIDSNPNPVDGKEPITVSTLYYWARTDNPTEFEALQEYNMYNQLKMYSFQNAGKIGDTQLAEALKKMFGHKFICDENKKSTSRGTQGRVWREFVFETDDREPGELYKWRSEKYPDTLHQYICKKLPEYIKSMIEDCENHILNIKESADSTKVEEDIKYLECVKSGINKTIFGLRGMSRIRSIISACEVEFRIGRRGFEASMDTNPNFIGVTNGVLKLYPETELIQRYHEIPISKHATVDYVPYDPNDQYIAALERELLTIFAGDRETYEFWMMILASGLDSREKNPQYLCIWEGCGAQGKSVISELDSNTLGLSGPDCSGGYATKMDVAYFCKDRKAGGPDSAISATKKVRRIWCAETESGAQLRMGQIKEILSEKITGNEKHEKQDVWKVNSHIMITTNHEIRIIGRDYGIWRRVLFQKFKMMFLDKSDERFDPNNKYHKECNPKIMNEWVSDIKYRQAYFSILTHYYEILRDKYLYNFNKIPRSKVNKYTRQYEARQDTISQFVYTRIIFIGDIYEDGVEVARIPMTTVVNMYVTWHTKNLGMEKFNINDIQNYLRAHRSIQSYIEQGISDNYLIKHKILDQGESYSDIQHLIPEKYRRNVNVKSKKSVPKPEPKKKVEPEVKVEPVPVPEVKPDSKKKVEPEVKVEPVPVPEFEISPDHFSMDDINFDEIDFSEFIGDDFIE